MHRFTVDVIKTKIQHISRNIIRNNSNENSEKSYYNIKNGKNVRGSRSE